MEKKFGELVPMANQYTGKDRSKSANSFISLSSSTVLQLIAANFQILMEMKIHDSFALWKVI